MTLGCHDNGYVAYVTSAAMKHRYDHVVNFAIRVIIGTFSNMAAFQVILIVTIYRGCQQTENGHGVFTDDTSNQSAAQRDRVGLLPSSYRPINVFANDRKTQRRPIAKVGDFFDVRDFELNIIGQREKQIGTRLYWT